LKKAENGWLFLNFPGHMGLAMLRSTNGGGMDTLLISEMKQLQAENVRLKRLYVDIAIQNELVQEALAKSKVMRLSLRREMVQRTVVARDVNQRFF